MISFRAEALKCLQVANAALAAGNMAKFRTLRATALRLLRG